MYARKILLCLFKQACAIKNTPHIVHVTINDSQNELAFAGEIAGRQLISRQYPITCFYDKATRQTAMLTVTASADGITSAVMKSFLKTLIRDALTRCCWLWQFSYCTLFFQAAYQCNDQLHPEPFTAAAWMLLCVLHRRHGKTRMSLIHWLLQ